MQQSKTTRIAGGVMLALTVLFCILPFLSMFSAALQPQGSMPEGIQFTAHPHWENFIDAWNIAILRATAQQQAFWWSWWCLAW